MKHVIFCLPGKTYTEGFFESWNRLKSAIAQRGEIRVTVSRGSKASIVHLRNELVAQNVTGPMKDATPFGGMPYDYMMWIDGDTVFTPEDFFKLLEADKDIISGMVPIDMSGKGALGLFNNHSPTCYLDLRATKASDPVFEIDFCGFAFVLVKHGVFESMTYPWFWPEFFMVGDRVICPGEDYAWCIRAKDLGWKLHAHPGVLLGHQKQVIIEVERAREPLPNLLEKFIDRYDQAWRLSIPVLKAIEQLLEQRRPQKVLEIGPGASSLLLLPWCRKHGSVYRALDHEGVYNEKHLATLQEADLPIETTFAVPLDGWYKTVPPAIREEAPYDLVIVDGPLVGRDDPRALAAYGEWGHSDTVWVFDDVHRQSEYNVSMQMSGDKMDIQSIQDPDYTRKTFLLTPKGK